MRARIRRGLTIGDFDDPGGCVKCGHGAAGGVVDVNARRLGLLAFVVGARPIEPSVPENNAAGCEHKPFKFADGGASVARELPSNALRDEARRSRRLRCGEQVPGSLPPHARISFAYRSPRVRQIGELVHHRLRLKGHDRRPQCPRIEGVAYDWLSAQIAQRLNLPRRARHTRNRVPSRDKQRDESHPDHTTRPRNKDPHQSELQGGQDARRLGPQTLDALDVLVGEWSMGASFAANEAEVWKLERSAVALDLSQRFTGTIARTGT